MSGHLLAGLEPLWPIGALLLGIAVLSACTASRRERADMRRDAMRKALREQCLADARAQLAADRAKAV